MSVNALELESAELAAPFLLLLFILLLVFPNPPQSKQHVECLFKKCANSLHTLLATEHTENQNQFVTYLQ